MNQILRMEDFLPKKEKEETKNRLRPVIAKNEERKKTFYFLELEKEADNLYKESGFTQFLLLDQYIKYYTIKNLLDFTSWKIKNSNQYKIYKKEFENKNLEELKNDLDDLKYNEITSREAYSLALIKEIEEKRVK